MQVACRRERAAGAALAPQHKGLASKKRGSPASRKSSAACRDRAPPLSLSAAMTRPGMKTLL